MAARKSRWDDVPCAMVELNRHGAVTDANGRMAQLLGVRRSTLRGAPIARWVVGPPPALEASVQPTSVCLRREDGAEVVTRWHIGRSTVRGRWACTVQASQELVPGGVELHLQQAQRVGRIGSWDLDLGTGRLWWSEEIFRIFEVDPATFSASYEGFLSLVHPDDRARVRESYERSVLERTQYDLTHRLLLADGREKWVHERCETYYGEGGQPFRSLGTVQDVTERLHIKGLLDDRERRLAAVFNATREAMLLFAVDGAGTLRVSDLNWVVHAQARRFVPGYTEQTFVGLTLAELCARVPPGMKEVLERFADRPPAPLAPGGIETFEVEVPLPGLVAHAEVSVTTVAQLDERPSLVLLVSREITERKQSEARLRGALAEKETLLREVHHRVKNNLQVVSSLLALQAGQVANPTVKSALAESRARIQTMAMVHERLYRSERFGSIDLAPHVRELLAMLTQTHENRQHVTLECDVDEVHLDLDTCIPLGLVLTELVSNAYKHAFPGGRPGRLAVRVRALPEALEVTVADDGVGLPTTLAVEQAQSLGLRIVRTLAHQLRAQLELESSGGTRAHLRIPRSTAAASGA